MTGGVELDLGPNRNSRPMRPTPASSARLRRAPSPALRPRTLDAAGLARFLARHRPRRLRDAPPRLRPAI